jgi:hypothetical protein
VRENMKLWKVCQIFSKYWPKKKREISDATVGRAWNGLLKEIQSPSEPGPVS